MGGMIIEKTIAIILLILYVGIVIYVNIFLLYKALKESWKFKDWELMIYCLIMLLTEIFFIFSFVIIFL